MVTSSTNLDSICQWLFLVPLKGGRDYIIPQLAVYTTYILPSGGLYNPYHLLGEPETAIEFGMHHFHTSLQPPMFIQRLSSWSIRFPLTGVMIFPTQKIHESSGQITQRLLYTCSV